MNDIIDLTRIKIHELSPLVISGFSSELNSEFRFIITGRWGYSKHNPIIVTSNKFKYKLMDCPKLPHLRQLNPDHCNYKYYDKFSRMETEIDGKPCLVLYTTYPAEPEVGIFQPGIGEILLFDEEYLRSEELEKKADFDAIDQEIREQETF